MDSTHEAAPYNERENEQQETVKRSGIRSKMKPAFAKLDGGLFSVSQKADVGDVHERMVAQGVAMMSWADPFMPNPSLPEPIQMEAIRAAVEGTVSHYFMPIGSIELRRALAERIYRKTGLKLDPNRNIIINPGSDVGLMFALFPFIGPGDEVLVHDPSYPNNMTDPELLGGVSVPVPTGPENGWHLSKEEYEKRITDRTKAVLLSNPNNPTGVCYTREELLGIAELCVKYDLVCIVDQAFEDTALFGHEMVTIAALPGMWERTVTVCSVSKGMGLSGFRVGWTYACDEIMDVYYGAAVNCQGAASTMGQVAVMPAIRDDAFIQDYLRVYERRALYAYDLFNSCPGVSMQLPEAGFYAWINVSALGTSEEVVSRLISEAKVNANDGKFYGSRGEGYIRLIIASFIEDAEVFAAMDRMAGLFRKMAAERGIA